MKLRIWDLVIKILNEMCNAKCNTLCCAACRHIGMNVKEVGKLIWNLLSLKKKKRVCSWLSLAQLDFCQPHNLIRNKVLIMNQHWNDPLYFCAENHCSQIIFLGSLNKQYNKPLVLKQLFIIVLLLFVCFKK